MSSEKIPSKTRVEKLYLSDMSTAPVQGIGSTVLLQYQYSPLRKANCDMKSEVFTLTAFYLSYRIALDINGDSNLFLNLFSC